MFKIIFSLMLISTISACSASLKEDKFIAQSKTIKPYDEEMLSSWQNKFPQHQLNQISLLSKDNSAQLRGIHLDNHNSDKVIFLIQGNGMEVERGGISMLLSLEKLGTDIVIFDRRGLGASSGKATISNLITDASQQYQFIQNELSAKKIIVHGYSLGSFIAAHLVKEQPVEALVLQGSATNVDDWVEAKTPWYVSPFLTIDIDPAFKVADNRKVVAKHYHGPLLIIAGENDQQVPAELSEQLYNASQSRNKTLIMVEGADHGNMFADAETIAAYSRFINAI